MPAVPLLLPRVVRVAAFTGRVGCAMLMLRRRVRRRLGDVGRAAMLCPPLSVSALLLGSVDHSAGCLVTLEFRIDWGGRALREQPARC